MSMSQDSLDFESLRRLLSLKRHEQPPPGYFNNLSTQVIARIKAGETGDEGGMERFFWEAPWLQRLWTALETKPVMAAAFGASVCCMLVGGIVYSEKADVQAVIPGPEASENTPMQIAGASPSEQPVFLKPASVNFPGKPAMPDSMTATMAAPPGIFDLVPKPKAEAASANLTLGLPRGN